MLTPAKHSSPRGKFGSASWFKNQNGSIAIITAVSLPMLLGFGGLAVDASLWVRAKSLVQGTADAGAASVAAQALWTGGGPCVGRLSAEATAIAAAHGFQNG